MDSEKFFDKGFLTEATYKWVISLDRCEMSQLLKHLYMAGLEQDLQELIDEGMLKGV